MTKLPTRKQITHIATVLTRNVGSVNLNTREVTSEIRSAGLIEMCL